MIAKTFLHMSCNVGKRTFRHVRTTKTQISLRICAVWSASLLSAWRNYASLAFQSAQRRFRSTCAIAQVDLNLCWAHVFEATISEVPAHTYPHLCQSAELIPYAICEKRRLRSVSLKKMAFLFTVNLYMLKPVLGAYIDWLQSLVTK